MLKVILIMFLCAYVLYLLYNLLVRPFSDGYNRKDSGGNSKNGDLTITYNPLKGKRPKRGDDDDYIDYEEVEKD
ncbi:MAG: hypothetical protein JJU02_08995 [Cryomorphaceae bacterium]|nr:hypothetical protein [Cryomorphaceae bacterium]